MRLSITRAIREFLHRWFGWPEIPPDPYAWVGAPKRRGPKDRAGAVALEEPPGRDDR